MRGILIVVSLLLCLGQTSFAQVTGDFYPKWAKEIKSPSFISGSGTSMLMDITSADHIILGSEFLDSIALCDTFLAPSGSTDLFLASVDTNGKLDWIVRGHATGYAWLQALTVDVNDNIYVAAHTYDTLILENDTIIADDYASGVAAKFSPNGNLIWYREFHGNGAFADAVATDPMGNVYFAFQYVQYLKIGKDSILAGSNFAYLGNALIKMDAFGTVLWYKNFYTGLGNITFMECDEQGNVYFANTGQLEIDNYTSPGTDIDDTYLVKIKPDGQIAWVKSATGSGNYEDQQLLDLTFDDEHVYWAGGFEGPALIDGDTAIVPESRRDIILIKYTKTGQRKWIKKMGGLHTQGMGRIHFNPLDNKLYATIGGNSMNLPGFTFHHPENRLTVMLARFDTSGNFEQVYVYGGTANGGEIEFLSNGDFVDLIAFRDSVVVGNDTFGKPYSPVDIHGVIVYFKNNWTPAKINPVPNDDFDLTVYPNPTSSSFTVALNLPKPAEIKLEMTDMLGRRILLKDAGKHSAGSAQVQLETGYLPPGVYILKATISAETISRKVVVE